MSPDAGPTRPIPWRDIFEDISERKGWTYDQIADMSLAQIANVVHQGRPPGDAAGRPAPPPGSVRITSDEQLAGLIEQRRRAGTTR